MTTPTQAAHDLAERIERLTVPSHLVLNPDKRLELSELIQSALDAHGQSIAEVHAETERALAMSRCAMETERDGLRAELAALRADRDKWQRLYDFAARP